MSEFLHDNEFERFLQQQVKHHRMYPSDAVWKGIYNQMHGDKKWPGLYFVAILLIAGLTVCTIFMDHSPNIIAATPKVAQTKSTPFNVDPEAVTHETYASLNQHKVSVTPTLPQSDIVLEEQPIALAETNIASVSNKIQTLGKTNISYTNIDQQSNNSVVVDEQLTDNTASSLPRIANSSDKPAEPEIENKPVQDNQFNENAQIPVALNNSKQSRWHYQVYMTPATTFKHTVDHKTNQENFEGPVLNSYGIDATKIIRYRPGMGTEFGLGALYDISKRFSLKLGVQYNVRQYNIEAYTGTDQVSSIALISGASINNVTTVAKFRSFSGAYNNDALLLNKYHQVSFPVGFEYTLLNRSRVGIRLGGTLQPTYTFSQSAYLLTSDYKSYADGTTMIRNWNINSSVEALLSVKVGDFQWKFGPQFRYQHLSTFTNQYPIREYLIDYGFKIGFAKSIK